MEETIHTNFRKAKVYRKRYLKFDIISSIVVFLVAIPLCLGIALASGAPLFSGLLSGIIGGIIVGVLSGSHVSVSGPAAGMAAVVLAALAQLGDFNVFLLALVFAGILQIVVGILKAGFIGEYIPSNVIQGLLCAIGILLIIKQLPFAFSLSSEISELKTHLLETTEGLTLKPIMDLGQHLDKGAIIISLISFSILIYFDKTKIKKIKEIPSPIIVVIIGIIINELFMITNSHLEQTTPQLVNIPTSSSINEFIAQFNYPDWTAWANPKVYIYGTILAIVASLESLLNLKASERLDKKRRHSSKNQELFAQGVGNLAAGLIGGIPVTSVIIRSSVNIQAGAKTKVAAILHGFLILVSVMFFPQLLNKIPLSSLAVILMYTGYKLTKPEIYKEIYTQGLDRFIPFIITVLSIVFLNLLTGIIIGLTVSLFFILKSHSQARFDILKETHPQGTVHRLLLPQQVSFLHKASLIGELDALPRRAQLVIDAQHTSYIDKEILELIRDFKEDRAKYKQISINLTGFKDHYDIHNYIDFINVTTYDVQSTLTPPKVLDILKEGNQRFINDIRIHRNPKYEMQHTAESQHPIAVVLGCIDSRVPVETIFDMTFGDLFCIRVAGNVVNDDILASIEYGCNVVGAKLVVVLGHTRCGAIQAAYEDVKKGFVTQLLKKIKPSVNLVKKRHQKEDSEKEIISDITKVNIANTVQQLYHESKIIKEMTDKNEIGLVGAVYDVSTGQVHFQDLSKDLEDLNSKKNEPLAKKVGAIYKNSDLIEEK